MAENLAIGNIVEFFNDGPNKWIAGEIVARGEGLDRGSVLVKWADGHAATWVRERSLTLTRLDALPEEPEREVYHGWPWE